MKRYQFSIKGLLKLTTATAVLLGVARLVPPGFLWGIAGLAAVVATGLAYVFLIAALVALAERVMLRERTWRLRKLTDDRLGSAGAEPPGPDPRSSDA